MKQSYHRLLLSTGIIIPIVFWLSTVIAGFIHGDYNHFKHTISQLGAIGTESEMFMTISTWICVLLSCCFFIGLSASCSEQGIHKLPLIGIAGFAVMFAWAAIFHAGHPLHARGGATMFLLLVAPVLAVIMWKGQTFRSIRLMSILSFCLMLLILLRLIPSDNIQLNYSGLIQRFVHLGWSVWFISLALAFLRRSSMPLQHRSQSN